jgi:hypothetical protein
MQSIHRFGEITANDLWQSSDSIVQASLDSGRMISTGATQNIVNHRTAAAWRPIDTDA